MSSLLHASVLTNRQNFSVNFIYLLIYLDFKCMYVLVDTAPNQWKDTTTGAPLLRCYLDFGPFCIVSFAVDLLEF